jgi:TonB family protein
MEAILLHELCHIKRADFLHNILQLMVETLFFYHPLSKWISSDVRKIREQCCDDLVLKLQTNPLVYAKALTNIASMFNHTHSKTSHIQIAANDGELLNRIKFLMIDKKVKSPITNIVLGLVFSFLALIVIKDIFNRPSDIQSSNTATFTNTPNSELATFNQNNLPIFIRPSVSIIAESQRVIPKQFVTLKPIINVNKTKQKIAVNNDVSLIVEQSPPFKRELSQDSSLTEGDINLSQEKTFSNIPQKETIVSPGATLSQKSEPPINSKVNSYPKIIKRVNPIYKRIARIRGIEGSVILSFNIDKRGRVKNIKIDKSSPLKLLDGNARQALRQWKFDPNSINESNIKNRYQQIFSFNLNKTNQCVEGAIGTRLNNQEICREL